MIRRPLVAAALIAAVILPMGLAGPAMAKKKKPKGPNVSFGSITLTPKTVPGNAAKINVGVTVTPTGGATVSSVTLRVLRGSTPAASSGLSPAGTNRWGKTNVSLPANCSGQTVNVDVYADASTNVGTKSQKLGTVKITSSVLDPNSPPPPPPI